MKRLPPSIQEDTRYLKYKIHTERTPDFADVVNSFWDTLLNEVGTIELSKAEVWIIKNQYDEEEREGVIQVNRGMEDRVRAALIFLEEVGNQDAFIEIKRTSGAISNL